jgi:diaminopimelate epimerase
MRHFAFTKMNGAGNDFVMLDGRDGGGVPERGEIVRLCDRHRGVGADGVLVVERGTGGLRMRYFNADGGEAEMCGNGARCFARYAARLEGITGQIAFETGAGHVCAELLGDRVALKMSNPHSERPAQDLVLAGRLRKVHFLNTGVPHAVAFVDDLDGVDVAAEGAAARHHKAFAPAGTNANFVSSEGPGTLRIRTYERGVEAETLACGTGVCAAALIHAAKTGTPGPVDVIVRGGDTLRVSFHRNGDTFSDVILEGPADFVFEGTISMLCGEA